MAFKRTKKPKTSAPRKRKIFLLRGALLFGATTFLCAGGVIGVGWHDYTRPGPLPTGQDIVVPHGGYGSTASVLQNNGVLQNDWWHGVLFHVAVVLTRHNGQLHAAELHFPTGVSLQETLWILRHAKPVLHRLTIPEGLTASQIRSLITNAPFLTGETPTLPEGSVLPQTYSYLRDSSRQALVEQMALRLRTVLQNIWQGRAPDETDIHTPEELLVLASLVEKETGVADERPLIARVFLNRLAAGMKLQTDPTVIYAVTHGNPPLGRPLTHTDLQTPSPYNTYQNTGLPPGPICAPGTQALEAAAHPAQSDALYFVANGTGGHNFAKTLSEHNQNVAQFRKKH
ncbi:endolytic transglycosylase MltG [Acetobacter suratthaniensis]|uniref:endolytic transglycosylase MltG n=1 Tax=Acetobacter suratthaniensis TaxID=1502841 RepID=UPI0038CFBE5D